MMQGLTLLSGATATSTGDTKAMVGSVASFQVNHSTSSGAGAAEVEVQVSNDGTTWIELCTFSLTLSTTLTGEARAFDSIPYLYVRAKVNSISGTGASVSLIAACEPRGSF